MSRSALISRTDMSARIADGETIEDLARRYGVHRSTIKRRALTLGVTLPSKPGPRRIFDARCLQVIIEFLDEQTEMQKGLAMARKGTAP